MLFFLITSLPHIQAWASDGPPAELNIMAQSTSIQRVQRLIDSVPLTNLLFTLLSTSYKKVQALERVLGDRTFWHLNCTLGTVLSGQIDHNLKYLLNMCLLDSIFLVFTEKVLFQHDVLIISARKMYNMYFISLPVFDILFSCR